MSGHLVQRVAWKHWVYSCMPRAHTRLHLTTLIWNCHSKI